MRWKIKRGSSSVYPVEGVHVVYKAINSWLSSDVIHGYTKLAHVRCIQSFQPRAKVLWERELSIKNDLLILQIALFCWSVALFRKQSACIYND